MGLPTLEKTWSFSTNNILPVSGDGGRTRALLWATKDMLVTAGWVVTSSSNGTTFKNFGDGSPDTWSDPSVLTRNNTWVVLENSTLGFFICLDWESSSDYYSDIVFSPTGFGTAYGGANGSLGTRPTATSQDVRNDPRTDIGVSSTRIVYNIMWTSDGLNFVFSATGNSSSPGAAWLYMGRPSNRPDLWTDGVVWDWMFIILIILTFIVYQE